MANEQVSATIATLSHLTVFGLIVTDDGTFNFSALARIEFNDDQKQILLTQISGEKTALSVSATQQFLHQTRQIAQSLQRQATSPLVMPGKLSRA
jgi:hypothetical protein